jgi:hypothetical protein
MSLENPNIFDRAKDSFILASGKVKLIITLAVALVVLGFVLFAGHQINSYRNDREAHKIKSNINAIASKITNLESKAVVDATQVAIEKDRLVTELKAYSNNQALTDEQKAKTDAAIAELEGAKSANYTNTTPAELKAILDQLEKQ